MSELHAELFSVMEQFHKLRIMDVFPEMTKSDCMMLLAVERLSEKKGCSVTVSELAQKLHTKNSAVSRTLKNLEEQGLIERTVNRADRRNTCVSLTEKGKREQQKIGQTMQELGKAVVSQMDEEDIRKLTACLNEVYEIAKREIEKRSKKTQRERDSYNGKDF